MTVSAAPAVSRIEVGPDQAGQRLDNFLSSRLKGVPKSRLYRIIRRGEVRVNGARSSPATRLEAGDVVRVPPIRTAAPAGAGPVPAALADAGSLVLYEDAHLLVIDKPAGVAVHGGSGIGAGVIEVLKRQRHGDGFLELGHRLDRDTSGCLVLAKSREALLGLHRLFRRDDAGVVKRYTALALGRWHGGRRRIDAPLARRRDAARGRARVVVAEDGRPAVSIVEPVTRYEEATLVRVTLDTGRMHQARVHLAHAGHPIAGDPVYGDFAANRRFAEAGLGRMFLHASELSFPHPVTGVGVRCDAPLGEELEGLLARLQPLRRTRQ